MLFTNLFAHWGMGHSFAWFASQFITILLWDSLDDLRAFAGPNYEAAVVPPERRKFLARYDERAAHYTVVSHPPLAGANKT